MLGFGGAGIGNLYRVLSDDAAAAAVHESYAAASGTSTPRRSRLRIRRVAHRRHTARRAAAARDFDQGGTPAGAHGPAGSVGRARGLFSPRPFVPVFDYSYDAVMRSHAESLERLGVARVDILLVHDIGRVTHGAAHAARICASSRTAAIARCASCRDSGAVRASASASTNARSPRTARAIRSRLRPARRSLHAARAARAAKPCCRCASAAAFRSLRRAVQLGHPRDRRARRRAGALQLRAAAARGARTCRRLEAVCGEFDVPLQAAALQFPLGHPSVASVVNTN